MAFMVPKDNVQISRVVESSLAAVETLCSELLHDIGDFDYSPDDVFAIHLALEEAFGNAVRHGNKSQSQKQVTVECLVTPEEFDIRISDEGNGFDPALLPDCRTQENLYKCCGRGVLLMRSYMDVVEFNEAGNCVHMIKYRSKADVDEDKDI
jgi:serine/threonine-protein kinase RsbW